MTETPESGKDDLPVVENEDGSLTYTAKHARANAVFLERRKATMGPNPTQEKARKLYEWWLSGCGTYIAGNYTPYGKLDEGQQQRWVMLSKALGDHPYHDHTPGSVEMKAERYKNIPAGLSWADYDNALHPEYAGYSDKVDGKGAYIHNDDPTYEEWVEKQPKLRQHWWQLWRLTKIFVEYDHYRRFIRDQARRRDAGTEPDLAYDLTKSSSR